MVRTLHKAAASWGYPQRFLTDNGRIFTTPLGSGVGAMEAELFSLGIATTHAGPTTPRPAARSNASTRRSRSIWPSRTRPRPRSCSRVSSNRFVEYYNAERPHRGIGRRRPIDALVPGRRRDRSGPASKRRGYRIRHDKVDRGGSVTLRHKGKLHHIGVGCPYAGWRVILLVARPRRAGHRPRRLTAAAPDAWIRASTTSGSPEP